MTDIRSGSMIPNEPASAAPTSPETMPSQVPDASIAEVPQPGQPATGPAMATPTRPVPPTPPASPKQHLWSAVMEAMAPHQYQTDPNTGETKTVQQPASFTNMMKGVAASAIVGMFAPNGANPAESFANGAAMGKARDDEMRKKSIDDAERQKNATLTNMHLARLNQEQLIGAMQLSQSDISGAQQMATANQPLIDRARDEGTLVQENLSEDDAHQMMQQQYPTTQFRYVVQGVEVGKDKGWTGRPQVHYRIAILGTPPDGGEQLPLTQATYNERAAAGMPMYKAGVTIPDSAQISRQAEDHAHSYMSYRYGPMKHEFALMAGTLGSDWKDASGQKVPAFPTDPVTVQALLKLQTEIVGEQSGNKEETNEGRILGKALDNLAKKNPQVAARAEAALGGSATISAYANKLEAIQKKENRPERLPREPKVENVGGRKMAFTFDDKGQVATRQDLGPAALTPDEEDVQAAAKALIEPYNLTALKDIASYRSDQRLKIFNAARKLDPTFSVGLVNQRIKFLGEYEDPKGRASINRGAINNIIMHASDLYDVNQSFRLRSELKPLNTPMNKIRDAFGSDTYTKYQLPIAVLKDELSLYFAGGYAPTKEQQATWDRILSNNATPAQVEAFSKEVIHLGLRRASTFNSQFKTNMGYKDPNMITPDARTAGENLLSAGDDKNLLRSFGTGGMLGHQGQEAQTQGMQPAAQNAPPVSSLKEGTHTTFANGQVWTLQGGKAVQVGK